MVQGIVAIPVVMMEKFLTNQIVSFVVEIFSKMTELPEMLGRGKPDLFCPRVRAHLISSQN